MFYVRSLFEHMKNVPDYRCDRKKPHNQAEMLALVFMEWVAQLLKERGIHIIIDGKALRGATEKIKGGNTPYVQLAKYKRGHWKIENNLHYVLDNVFREDRSTAKGGKNNLALIRKFAYNLLRLAIIKEHPEWGMQRMMDYFSDHPEMTEKYIFGEIESFY